MLYTGESFSGRGALWNMKMTYSKPHRHGDIVEREITLKGLEKIFTEEYKDLIKEKVNRDGGSTFPKTKIPMYKLTQSAGTAEYTDCISANG